MERKVTKEAAAPLRNENDDHHEVVEDESEDEDYNPLHDDDHSGGNVFL